MQYLITSATLFLSLFPASSLALGCIADAYSGAGPGGTCTGQRIAQAAQNGDGTGPCIQANNAACALVGDATDGANCDVELFHGNCDGNTPVGCVTCDPIGATAQVNFNHFWVHCEG